MQRKKLPILPTWAKGEKPVRLLSKARGEAGSLMGRGRVGESKSMKGMFREVTEILGIWVMISL